jgi:hypothetical protein
MFSFDKSKYVIKIASRIPHRKLKLVTFHYDCSYFTILDILQVKI